MLFIGFAVEFDRAQVSGCSSQITPVCPLVAACSVECLWNRSGQAEINVDEMILSSIGATNSCAGPISQLRCRFTVFA